jgi:hypothetical protein
MMAGRYLPCLIACILTFSAQTPAPGAPPSATKPLRHLEYSFAVHRQGLTGQQFNGSNTPLSYEVSGSNTGGSGTMSVDVLSLVPDGALAVRISETVSPDAHPLQSYDCTVYGNTMVACPAIPAPSQAEWILLSYMGRRFVEGAPWDAQHRWKRTQDTERYSLIEDFTLLPTSTDKRAIVREAKTVQVHNGGFNKEREDVLITYDRAMEIPDAVHDDFTSTGGSEDTGHATFDFTLIEDSFATRGGS